MLESLRPLFSSSSLLAPMVAISLTAAPAFASPISATLPETPMGQMGGQIIAHINQDTPDAIRQWGATILSPSVEEEAQATFLKELGVAARDSGGVDFVDARTQGPPGMLVVTIKGRRTGQRVALVLMADPDVAGKLQLADIVPVDDPALYEAWPDSGAATGEIARLAAKALDDLERANDFSGCLSISDGTAIIFEQCRGMADRTFGIAADQNSKFLVGSINKMVTAVAIGQLVEEGKLGWETTLSEIMPEYPDQERAGAITIWQLLQHTAGLGDIFVPEFSRQRQDFVEPGDYLDLIARQPVLFAPGEDWSYSNAGYVLLGRIIENVSGERYFDYVERRIFAPAGMRSSGFASIEDITPGLATGYFREGAFANGWKANWMTLPYKGSPAGGGYSTPSDLIRFADALRGGKLLKAATVDRMFENGIKMGPGSYAAGFGERLSHGLHVRGHAGGAPGMSANLAIVWETGATIAVTSNQGDTPTAMLLSERIADLFAAQAAKP